MRRQPTRAALVGAFAVTLAACATGSGETTGTEDGSTDDGGGQFDSAAELSGELEIMGFGLATTSPRRASRWPRRRWARR